MTNDDAKSDDERLAEILASMGQSVREWVGELESVAQRLIDASARSDRAHALKALRDIAHDISGSAGTLGFADIGNAAWPLETMCAGFVDTDAEPTDEERQKIVDLAGRVVTTANRSFEDRVTQDP